MRNLHLELPVLALSFFIPIHPVDAEEPLKPLRTEVPPVIDGKLDEPLWRKAPSVSGFKTYSPDFGIDMVEKTEAYMAYDTEHLYFAFRCFDRQPDKIKSSITSRDNIRPDDWVCINLDSFNDQQSLYAFYTNPMGIQSDSRFAAGQEDYSIDLVWYSGGQMDDEGYTVEASIPLKSIRFSDKNPVDMGIIFERRISRRSEQGTYPALNPERGYAFLTQMKPMIYYDLKHYTLFELLPAATYSQKYRLNEGRLVIDDRRGDFGLTAKYGITSDLILDGTYNPDFSQVEADAGQVDVNLRYDLFYPEKRPFFLEGNENFRIAASSASELDPIQSIVHTRTIVNPLAGVKLSGKIGEESTVAAIYAVDELPTEQSRLYGNYAHFPILRYKRTLEEDSYFGGIYAGMELKNRFNRVLGIDGMYRLNQSTMLEYQGLLSRTKLDDKSLEKGGHAVGLRYRYDTRDINYDFSIKEISGDFFAEMGYLTRTGILGVTGLVRPKFYPKSDVLRRVDAELFTAQTQDKFSHLWETFNHISFQHYLWGSLNLKLKYSYSTEIFLGEKFQTGGFQVSGGGQFTKELYINLVYRKGKAIYYAANPYQGRSNRVTASLRYQPSDKLEANLSFVYSDFFRDYDGQKIYDYPLTRIKLTYQLNKYLFFRGILEYNDYRREMLTDFLASFTYIPGTVMHIGYGSLYQKIQWNNGAYVDSDRFLEAKRGLFFKMSYLWRM